ncbi:MAG: MgtC/SapB family protein [Candidatus Yanofskybacteria bacterium]|nr:MgtC/SapB family protein [Candidatus Yanofskybacteria bacterium]
MLEFPETFFRILLATAFGAAIGFERERSHKSAGLRTNALVAMGASLITVISLSAFSDNPLIDPTRIISNIIVGIGFIGGGAIIQQGQKIRGITTAATLWVVAAIGITIGMGFYREAVFSVLVVYFILTFLWLVEKKTGNKILYQGLKEDEFEK